MPTELTDRTDERLGETWGNLVREGILKRFLSGTVCFPLDPHFGCGSDRTIGVEEEKSLEGKFIGSGFELTIGTKTTRREEWAVKSGPCQWCKPEICFPDSRVEVWTCSDAWSFYFYHYDRTYFFPGSTSELHSNCVINREKCQNCEEHDDGGLNRQNAWSQGSNVGLAAVIIEPTMLYRNSQESTKDYDPAQSRRMPAAVDHTVLTPRITSRAFTIGIKTPSEPINWLYPFSRPSDDRRISLLSSVSTNYPTAPLPFSGRFFPVLAVTQLAEGAKCEISISVTSPEGSAEPPFNPEP